MVVDSLRIIFAGTPVFAAQHLNALIGSRHQVISVYTQPDRPAGRGKKIAMSPVKQLANHYQLPVFQPISLKDDDSQRGLLNQRPDVVVVVAYGLILPAAIVEAPRYGCINVHASLLPRWRGAAPIQRAIAAGDAATGITIMKMDRGLDTGPILFTVDSDIQSSDTSAILHDRLLTLGPPALLHVLDTISVLQPRAQDETRATYAPKVSKEEAKIDWSLPAEKITRSIRAFNPFPVAYTMHKRDRIKVYRAEPRPLAQISLKTTLNAVRKLPGEIIAVDSRGILVMCGDGAINLLELQLPGKRVMTVQEFLNGYPTRFRFGDFLY